MMANKLEQIEAHYPELANMLVTTIPAAELMWLIARVRKLEKALGDIKASMDGQRSIARKLPYHEALDLIEVMANRALKED